MEHKGTVRIETERLVLKRHVLEDAEIMFKNWVAEKEVTKFMSWQPHKNVEETRQLLSDWIASYEKPDFYFWTMELKESHELVGDISVVNLDEATESVELGYGIGSRWWGKGITAEAGKALVTFFFEEVKAKRVYAKHAAGNPNSGRVMQKIGMKKEGIIRQSGRCNQDIVDEVYYSILRDEYFGIGTESRTE